MKSERALIQEYKIRESPRKLTDDQSKGKSEKFKKEKFTANKENESACEDSVDLSQFRPQSSEETYQERSSGIHEVQIVEVTSDSNMERERLLNNELRNMKNQEKDFQMIKIGLPPKGFITDPKMPTANVGDRLSLYSSKNCQSSKYPSALLESFIEIEMNEDKEGSNMLSPLPEVSVSTLDFRIQKLIQHAISADKMSKDEDGLKKVMIQRT